MVSDMPGTTRDAIDAMLTWHRRQFRIVDTAGMRRPGRVARGGKVEAGQRRRARRRRSSRRTSSRWSSTRTQGATDQDAAIAGEADSAGRGVVIVANKWDLVKERRARLRRRGSTRRCGVR